MKRNIGTNNKQHLSVGSWQERLGNVIPLKDRDSTKQKEVIGRDSTSKVMVKPAKRDRRIGNHSSL
jgi:hypothetical protein